ncbi:unnamed protein product [Rotaria sp. Silwood1]|nr:unnamed protein product [Rotaria sp. Silwood1]
MIFGDKNIDKHAYIAGETIDNVEKYEYLGSLITWDNDCSEDIKQRIAETVKPLSCLKRMEKQQANNREQDQDSQGMRLKCAFAWFRNTEFKRSG